MADPQPDPERPERKRRERGGRRRGRPGGYEGEQSVISGRDFLMGLDPTKNKAAFLFSTPDDIIRKFGGFREYKKMRHDDVVKTALYFKKILVYGRAWDIDPATDKDADSEVASFVHWALKRANIKTIIKEMLTALEYGFSVGEIIWEATTYKGKPCIALKTIKFRDPETVKIYMDKHGNIAKIVQEDTNFAIGGGREIDLPLNKIVHWAYQGELGNPYGTSDLRSIYKNWWAKKYLVNFWNVYLERLGSPTLLMKYPKGAGAKLQASLKNILSSLGNRAEILVPDGVNVDVLESTRAGQATFNEALTYHDGAMGRGILVPALLGFGEKQQRGADSQARLQLRTLFKVTDEIGQEITNLLTKAVITPMVDFNFYVEEYPELIWADYGEYEATEIADAIRLIHNAGIIDPDQEDVNYVRGLLGLPVRARDDDEDEVLRPNPAPQGVGANPPTDSSSGGASQGNERGATGAEGEEADARSPNRT